VSSQQTEFADFFQASWEPCLRAVVAVVGSPHLAEDQVAEAFAKAWVSWRKVRRHPAPRAWVVRTALNTGASWWRRRRRELPLADHDLTAPGDLGGGLDATLLTAIWRLPARQREVIALRIFLDLDTAAVHQARVPDSADLPHPHRPPPQKRAQGLHRDGLRPPADAAHQQLASPLVVVWDNLNAHVSGVMADLIAARDWLTVYRLPP
jgi:Sigma-70 region 2